MIRLTKDGFNASKTEEWARLRRKVGKLAPPENAAKRRSRRNTSNPKTVKHGRRHRTR